MCWQAIIYYYFYPLAVAPKSKSKNSGVFFIKCLVFWNTFLYQRWRHCQTTERGNQPRVSIHTRLYIERSWILYNKSWPFRNFLQEYLVLMRKVYRQISMDCKLYSFYNILHSDFCKREGKRHLDRSANDQNTDIQCQEYPAQRKIIAILCCQLQLSVSKMQP